MTSIGNFLYLVNWRKSRTCNKFDFIEMYRLNLVITLQLNVHIEPYILYFCYLSFSIWVSGFFIIICNYFVCCMYTWSNLFGAFFLFDNEIISFHEHKIPRRQYYNYNCITRWTMTLAHVGYTKMLPIWTLSVNKC